jgi:hypothetical protein
MFNTDKKKEVKDVKQPDYQTISAAFTKEIDVTLRSMNANGSTVFAVNAAITKSTNEAAVPVNYKAFGEVIKKYVDEALKTNNASAEMVAAVDATIAKVVAQFEAESHIVESAQHVERQQRGDQFGKIIQNKDGWGNEYNNLIPNGQTVTGQPIVPVDPNFPNKDKF